MHNARHSCLLSSCVLYNRGIMAHTHRNIDSTQRSLVFFKTLAFLFFLIVCCLVAFVGLSDVAAFSRAPALQEAVVEFTSQSHPWYVWFYALSALGAFVTVLHEIYVYGELQVKDLFIGFVLVAIPLLNTYRCAMYMTNFVHGKSIIWTRHAHHGSQGW